MRDFDLTDEHVDQLARVMAEPINGAQIERVAERTNTKSHDQKASWGKEDRLVAYLANVNRAGKIDEVLAMLIDKLDMSYGNSLADDIDEILVGTPYTLQFNGTRYELAMRTQRGVAQIEEQHHSLIKDAAPLETVARLDRANHLLAEGDYNNAIHDCRRALENLTVDGNYGSALADLDTSGLISGDSWNHPLDWQALKLPYNYCSNVGSHGGSKAPEATRNRAELAFRYTQEATVFILQVTDEPGSSLPDSWDLN
jgi:hypothetical protein